MPKTIYANELIKRKFFSFLKESEGFSQQTLNAFEQGILLWQDYSKNGDFAKFGKRKAIEFKTWLKNKNKPNSEEKISLSYCYHTLKRLQRFFDWLSKQPNYKSKINSTHIKFLRLSKKETRTALTPQRKSIPTISEIKQVIEGIKINSEVDQRDRALISFVLLTGIRISAAISLPLKCFDKVNLIIDQNPNMGVKTKFSKTITTALFPFPYTEPKQYFLEWIDYLESKGFKPNDPIFPASSVENGKENINYHNTGNIKPVFWEKSGAARKIFEKRFADAGIPYYNPHSLRHLVVKEFTKIPLTEEEKKAISQNLGHANVGTTFGSYGYGQISEDRQIEIVRNISFGKRRQQNAYLLTDEKITELIQKAQQAKK